MDAINAGQVQAALVIGAEKMTHLPTSRAAACLSRAASQLEKAGQSFPAIFARFARAYADRFGDPAEAMAKIASKNHVNAMARRVLEKVGRSANSLRHYPWQYAKTPANEEIAGHLSRWMCTRMCSGKLLSHRNIAIHHYDLPSSYAWCPTNTPRRAS